MRLYIYKTDGPKPLSTLKIHWQRDWNKCFSCYFKLWGTAKHQWTSHWLRSDRPLGPVHRQSQITWRVPVQTGTFGKQPETRLNGQKSQDQTYKEVLSWARLPELLLQPSVQLEQQSGHIHGHATRLQSIWDMGAVLPKSSDHRHSTHLPPKLHFTI